MKAVVGEECLAAVWERWLRGRGGAEREALICHYLPLVRFLARRIGQAVAPSNRPDLVGFGVFGLIDAIERYDPAVGARFETYASRRINGAIRDGVRRMSYFPRGAERRASRVIEKVVAVDFQSARNSLGVRLDDALSERVAGSVGDALDLEADHLEVVEAVALLPERDRFVIEQHYYSRRSLREIGADLGVTESRVCQLHRRALRVLQEVLVGARSA